MSTPRVASIQLSIVHNMQILIDVWKMEALIFIIIDKKFIDRQMIEVGIFLR